MRGVAMLLTVNILMRQYRAESLEKSEGECNDYDKRAKS